MSRLLISGFYGFDNAGDEAVLAAMLQLFRERRPDLDLTVLSAAPDATRRLHGVDAVPRMSRPAVSAALKACDLFVSGGGSLIQDTTSARSALYYLGLIYFATRLRKPVALYCQGIGPLRRPALRRLSRAILNRTALITVRDEVSARELERLGVGVPHRRDAENAEVAEIRDLSRDREGAVGASAPVRSAGLPTGDADQQVGAHLDAANNARDATAPSLRTPLPHGRASEVRLSGVNKRAMRPTVYVAADPVFALAPAPEFDPHRWLPPEPGRGWLGVSVRPWPGIDPLLPRLGEALRDVACQTGLTPLLLPLQWDMDHPVCTRLAAHVPAAAMLQRPGLDPRGWLALTARLRALAAMRLHALIFAASQSIPLAGIAYDPKVTALLERLGDRPAATVESFDPQDFAQAVVASLADTAAAQRRHNAAAEMAEAARAATELTLALLRI